MRRFDHLSSLIERRRLAKRGRLDEQSYSLFTRDGRMCPIGHKTLQQIEQSYSLFTRDGRPNHPRHPIPTYSHLWIHSSHGHTWCRGGHIKDWIAELAWVQPYGHLTAYSTVRGLGYLD